MLRIHLLSLLIVGLAAPSAHAQTLVTVFDGGGQPVVAAAVQAFIASQSGSLLEMRRQAIAEGVTDGEGRVALDVPAVEGVRLVVDSPRHAPLVQSLPTHGAASLRLVVAPGEAPRLSLRWPADGLPPAGEACLHWSRAEPQLLRSLELERCTSIGEGGSIVLAGVEPGARGQLEVKAEGYLPLVVVYPWAEQQTPTLERGFLVVGRVIDPHGRPLGEARATSAEGLVAETSRDGSFSVALGEVPQHLEVRAPGFRTRKVPAGRDLRPLTVQLEPGPTLSGTLFDDGGAPLPAARLRIEREQGPGQWRRELRDLELIDGEFLIDLLQPGRLRFRISAEGHRPLDLPAHEVGPASALDLGVQVLATGAGVAGKVVDAASGQPLGGALVRLLPRGLSGLRRSAETVLAEAVTDAEGHYRILGEPSGAYELRFERNDYATTALEIDLEEGRVLALGDQLLGRGCRVLGQVRARSGIAQGGVRVRFLTESGTAVLPIVERTTNGSGRFTAMYLSPGTYRVEVKGRRPLLVQTVEVPEGEEELTLDLLTGGTRVEGLVTRREQPAEGGWLTLEPAFDPGHRSGKLILAGADGSQSQVFGPLGAELTAEVGPDGTFAFEDVPAGPATAVFLSAAGEELRQPVEVPATPTALLAIDFAGSPLVGLVVDTSDRPLSGAQIELRDGLGNLIGQGASDELGSFELRDLPSGALVLEVSKPGHARRTLGGLDPARLTAPLRIELEPAAEGALALQLARPDGEPLSYAFATLFSSGGALVRSLPLDALGEKRYADLPAGGYFLVWSDPTVGAGASPPLEIRPGEESVFARQLALPARLDLLCEDPACAGQTISALSLLTEDGFDLGPLLSGFSLGLTFSLHGAVSLGGVQPGRYRLLAQSGGKLWNLAIEALAGAPLAVSLRGSDPIRVAAALPSPPR